MKNNSNIKKICFRETKHSKTCFRVVWPRTPPKILLQETFFSFFFFFQYYIIGFFKIKYKKISDPTRIPFAFYDFSFYEWKLTNNTVLMMKTTEIAVYYSMQSVIK